MSVPLSRRHLFRLGGASAAALALAACAGSSEAATAATPTVPALPDNPTAAQALQALKDGNARFVAAKPGYPNQTATLRASLTDGQKPFATVIGCVDSRVPPELVFDQGLGDLLVCRNAAHVVDDAAMGSTIFGATALGIPLIVVLGHNSCGAVSAAIGAVETNTPAPDAVDSLVQAIKPAIKAAEGKPGNRNDNVERAHTELTVALLKVNKVLAPLVTAGTVQVVGAEYDLASGKVTFLG